MGLIHKSALLSLLRLRLEQERTADWQTLHIRDREWYLEQHESGQWGQLRGWLEYFGERDGEPFSLLSSIISAIGLITGFLLIAGLLEFHTFERINLLLLLLFAVIIPLLVWVIGLMLSTDSAPLLPLIKRRLPQWPGGPTAGSTLQPLLRQTALLLGQQFSLLFAIGMVLGMLLYILLTDLAFGWSSTLDLSPDSLLAVTSIIAWPWQWLWPDAAPTLTLIEQTQYFRSAPMAVNDAAVLGQWWRFLLMSLLTYLLLPRLLSYGFHYRKLRVMQRRLLDSDALITGLWQRMTTEVVNQEADNVEQLHDGEEAAINSGGLPVCKRILRWGVWPPSEWLDIETQLQKVMPEVLWQPLEEEAQLVQAVAASSVETLLICKGWEPPTGELADFCQLISSAPGSHFIWPVALSGMSSERTEQLNHSWRAFMPQLPESFNLLSGRAVKVPVPSPTEGVVKAPVPSPYEGEG
ncbi:MAG: DUF2868 domain-containing protein [Candidatus Sedimenticola sp. (ex Thyasira tokunagai)]